LFETSHEFYTTILKHTILTTSNCERLCYDRMIATQIPLPVTETDGSTYGKLYLSGRSILQSQEHFQIQYMVSLMDESVTKLPTIEHDIIPIDDDTSLDTVVSMNEILNRVIPKIHQYIIQGKNVGIHCRAGVSRSSTVVIDYLCTYFFNHDVKNATTHVQRYRSVICPNVSFFQLLFTRHSTQV